MICPSCGGCAVRVYGTVRLAAEGGGLIKRYRVCEGCGARWITFEEIRHGSVRHGARCGDRWPAQAADCDPDQG
ncbi:hypothetical protein [Pseudothauera hydrothermalis]|uniref:NrdR family transcriptional regulator n=1 Tax=Pseudothauera hydrothermalis TaxID=2184083 RepID=UPI003AAB676B